MSRRFAEATGWIRRTPAIVAAFGMLMSATSARAVPVAYRTALSGVDWVSAGIGGVGGGSGNITVTGVSGTVTSAQLYWNGINNSGAGAVYNNPNVTFAGHAVTGVSLGDATTNCWGEGSSRAFRADVTPYVSGNGVYSVSGLSALPGHNANGASLIVVFDDGNPSNNRDLVFFEGNDSNIPSGFPGEDPGWNATLGGINYQGGSVNAQFHLADGQNFPDDVVTFTSGFGTVTIPDTTSLWDGNSVPDAGTSRASNGSLWDINTIDVTGAFGPNGPYTLTLSGQVNASDCLGLTVLLFDLKAGSVPACGDGVINQPSEQCDDGNTVSGDGCDAFCQKEGCGNGLVDQGEPCDASSPTGVFTCAPTEVCSPQCTCVPGPVCGNGVVDQGEPCDLSSPTGAFTCAPNEQCSANCTCIPMVTTTTVTTTTMSTTTTVPSCVPTGPETGHCNDMVDNDCNGLIDCADPACQPGDCLGGTQDDLDCSTPANQAACVAGGGVCQCPNIDKDPTTIKFGPRGSTLGRLKSHGRFTLVGAVDVKGSDFGTVIANSRGQIYSVTLPANSLVANSSGTSFKYKNVLAATHGGFSKVSIRVRNGLYRYTLEAYGDMSRATDKNMSIQLYLGSQPTPAIHNETWTQKAWGWRADGF